MPEPLKHLRQFSKFAALFAPLPAGVALGDEPALSVGGLVFGDAYHITSHHLPEGDGATAAVLRRAYLTIDAESDSNWFARLRLEANQSGAFEVYDYEVDYKDVYLGYRFGDQQLVAGLQPTPTFDVIERAWGKRYLMRTPADLQGVPSRDVGVSLKGRLSDKLSYRAMIGTGQDFGAESGDGSAKMLALNWRFNEHWAADFYLDSERRPGEADVESRQIFLAYSRSQFRAGAQYGYRDREAEAPATLFLAAYEYRINDRFVVTPNSIVIAYDQNDEGVRPETDVYFRLTFFMDWE